MSDMLKRVKHILSKHVYRLNQGVFYYAFIRWVRHLFRADVVHIKIHHENLDRPVVIVSNHISNWDPFLILSAIPRNLFFNRMMWRVSAYHGFFKRIWFIHYRIFFKLLSVYSIEGKGDLAKSLETTIQLLGQGNSTVFFPEGKRVVQGEEVQPKKGIGYLLKHTNVYVLPVHLSYSKRRRRGFGARIGRARVVIGDIIKSEYFVENYDDDTRHIAVMQHVQEVSEMNVPQKAMAIAAEKVDIVQ